MIAGYSPTRPCSSLKDCIIISLSCTFDARTFLAISTKFESIEDKKAWFPMNSSINTDVLG